MFGARHLIWILAVIISSSALLPIAGGARAANLLKDGGFESPIVPPGSYTTFVTGQKIGPWTVIGQLASLPVSLVSTTYQNGQFHYNAHRGQQYLNLAIFGEGAYEYVGISQSVSTAPGTAYALSFWLGLVPNETSMTDVGVFVNGLQLTSAYNSEKSGRNDQVWKKFSTTFTATTSSTTIAIMSTNFPSDNIALDDVSLEQAN